LLLLKSIGSHHKMAVSSYYWLQRPYTVSIENL